MVAGTRRLGGRFAWPLTLLLAACTTSGLEGLVCDGRELHASLATPPPEELLASPIVLEVPANPHLSTDPVFVENIARRSNQGGALRGDGIRAALLALHVGPTARIGFYGLEAESSADADRIEPVLRGTWAHNESLGVARVHRAGEVLVVVWAAGGSPAAWEAINAAVAERLNGR